MASLPIEVWRNVHSFLEGTIYDGSLSNGIERFPTIICRLTELVLHRWRLETRKDARIVEIRFWRDCEWLIWNGLLLSGVPAEIIRRGPHYPHYWPEHLQGLVRAMGTLSIAVSPGRRSTLANALCWERRLKGCVEDCRRVVDVSWIENDFLVTLRAACGWKPRRYGRESSVVSSIKRLAVKVKREDQEDEMSIGDLMLKRRWRRLL